MNKSIAIILGTRPEVIRFSPIIKNLIAKSADFKVIHTGQHYSTEMNQVFFDELNLPVPDINLNITQTDPSKQLGEIITNLSQIEEGLDCGSVCVWGDTTSSLAAALVGNKKKTKVFHIEAGCRSGDFRMAEEFNRILIDNLSDVLYPLSSHDENNLLKEHIHGKVLNLGDPLYDVFLENIAALKPQQLTEKYKLTTKFGILTLHRAENVDNPKTLRNIINALNTINSCKILFPMHPRTKKMMNQYDLVSHLTNENIVITEPLGYLEILELLTASDFVITDSGGFQKEAFYAKKPCFTLRKTTEWEDTVRLGVNMVIDPESKIDFANLPDQIVKLNSNFPKISEFPYGTGNSSKMIVESILNETA